MKSSISKFFGFGYVASAALGGCGVIAGLDDFKDAPPAATGGGGTGDNTSSATSGGMGGTGGMGGAGGKGGMSGGGGALATCGDGVVDANEECDGGMIDHATCVNCKIVCDANWANCDTLAENGCEADTLTDKLNCGSCGRDCQDTNCATGLCLAKLIGPDEAGVRGIAIAADGVYWANVADGRIGRFKFATETVTYIQTGFMTPNCIAVDDTYVFVGSGGDFSIKRMLHDGTALTTIATDMPNPPTAMTLDGDNVYWTTYVGSVPPKGNLYRVLKAGGTFTKLPMAFAPSSSLIADGTYLYYGTQEPKLSHAPIALDKEEAQTWISNGRARGMAIDTVDKWLYWSTENGVIWKMKSFGGTAVQLIKDLGGASSADLALDNGTLYVQAAGIKEIFSLSLADGTKTVLATTKGGLGNIAVNSTHVYWSDSVNGTVSRVVR